MWGFFKPKRTVLSVVQELVEGFDQGTVAVPCPEEEMSDTQAPARHFNAAPGADDGEVIDEAWLRAVGFVPRRLWFYEIDPDHGRYRVTASMVSVDYGRSRVWRLSGSAKQPFRMISRADCHTRGEVRRVFEFLGVPIPTEGIKDA